MELKVVKDNLQKCKNKIQKLENIITEQSLKLHVFEEENTKLKTFKDLSNVEKDLGKEIKILKSQNDQLFSELHELRSSKLYKNFLPE